MCLHWSSHSRTLQEKPLQAVTQVTATSASFNSKANYFCATMKYSTGKSDLLLIKPYDQENKAKGMLSFEFQDQTALRKCKLRLNYHFSSCSVPEHGDFK